MISSDLVLALLNIDIVHFYTSNYIKHECSLDELSGALHEGLELLSRNMYYREEIMYNADAFDLNISGYYIDAIMNMLENGELDYEAVLFID